MLEKQLINYISYIWMVIRIKKKLWEWQKGSVRLPGHPESHSRIQKSYQWFHRSLSLPKCQISPRELTRQEWKDLQKRDRQKALLQSVSGRVKTNKKLCVWKYLPFSCLFLSCDIISHVGHQSCSELMTHPAHESFSSFPQPQQGMLGLFLLSSCWSKAVPEPGRICQHQHFDLSLWNR